MQPVSLTHELELTEPVQLCAPDGRRLDPRAKGWSRTPLLTANLRGGWPRTKRWDYWAVLAGDLVVSTTYADVDYLGLATTWWCDLPSGDTGGADVAVPLARGLQLPDRPGSEPLRWHGKGLDLEQVDEPERTTIAARWTEHDGRAASLDLVVDQPPGHEALHVVIPWSDRRFQYTAKHQARPAHGVLRVGDDERHFGGEHGDAWGVLDVGRGRWPYSTRWNWGGGAGHTADGRVVGLQLGAKWTEGTGFTENGVLVDGRLTKLGEELTWAYDWDHPLEPWHVHGEASGLDLVLHPTYDKHSKTDALVLRTEVHQVFGTWTGHVTAEDGTVHQLGGDVQGFAEESRSRW
jgi:hypothetical protein